tara:strand:- start:595 stop:3918 length:3324 start_codon:yes stop_codon:yes gene_type:complete
LIGLQKTFKILFLLILILPIVTALAAEPSIRFKHLSIKDGLPQNTSNEVFQDSTGFLWVCTQDGLARYDGYSFKTFRHSNVDPDSLSANITHTITQDSQGYIWVGTWSGGLNRFDPNTEKFTHYRFDAKNANSLSHDDITAIQEDHRGNLWIGTRGGGLNLFDPKTESFSHYRFDENNPNSLSHDEINAITEDNIGNLWVGTRGGGLNRFDPKSEKFSYYRFEANNINSLSHDDVLAITLDDNGNIWLGTRGGGLNVLNPKTGEFIRYRADENDANSISNDYVWAITVDQQGEYWLGTDNGLSRFDAKTELFKNYRFEQNNSYSLSDDTIRSITEDDQGNIWIGTLKGGINFLNLKSEQFNHYQFKTSNNNLYENNNIYAVREDDTGGIWLGTYGGGLIHAFKNNEQFKRYQLDDADLNSLSDNFVRAIAEDWQGNIWLGTEGGLNHFDRKSEKFSHYRFDENNPNSLSSNVIYALKISNQGLLWMGTSGGGLNRFDPKTKQFKRYRFDAQNSTSLSNNEAYVITEDSADNLWIGTIGGGLNRFDPNIDGFVHYRFDANDAMSLSDDNVRAITEDSKGNIWVGTSDGFNLLDIKSNKFKRFNVRNGLPSNVVYTIEIDDEGFLWMSTNQGLSKFDPKTETFKNYDFGDGLQNNEFNKASFKSSNGELFFGGIDGFNRFYPNEITESKLPPVVIFTDMLLSNKSVAIGKKKWSDKIAIENNTDLSKQGVFTLDKPIHLTTTLTLPYTENLVAFEFAALHFTNTKKNQYAYRLEGWDNNWITTDYMNRRATYTNLPSGEYNLRVKASNAYGIWNKQGAQLKLIILPPPWRTWWAYTIYTLACAFIIFAFVRTQKRKVMFERKLSTQLEQKVKERTKELKEAYSQLEEVSLTDQLTGLKNRRFLLKNIENDLALVGREYYSRNSLDKTETSDLIFFLIDIDHFKQVNDIYGHSTGDAVLVQIKSILLKVFRETDYLVRWGGEEFLVVARFTERSSAAMLAERLRLAVEAYDFHYGETLILKKTCSIGFACYPFTSQVPDALTWIDIVDIADHALYIAKRSSRNAWVGLVNSNDRPSDDLFIKVTQDTQALVKSNDLQLLTSITEHNDIRW